MNKDLDTIFLQIDTEDDFESRGSEATWCVDQINEDDTEYVRADILHKILDEAEIVRTSSTIFQLERRDGGVDEHPKTIIFSVEARTNLIVAQLREQKKMRDLYERKTREIQGEKITSMVRRSRRLSEEEEAND